ncbi:hypothetical protein H920_11491 [Fukomys damarensis]|uniref:Uncharacterized protein n=1 Tax=Fukomys damarensis TaxID=885580 RepID=A0A091DWA6_FUKDA|nr:hypothetical protein H920_11491 [Fukomys damarensis]
MGAEEQLHLVLSFPETLQADSATALGQVRRLIPRTCLGGTVALRPQEETALGKPELSFHVVSSKAVFGASVFFQTAPAPPSTREPSSEGPQHPGTKLEASLPLSLLMGWLSDPCIPLHGGLDLSRSEKNDERTHTGSCFSVQSGLRGWCSQEALNTSLSCCPIFLLQYLQGKLTEVETRGDNYGKLNSTKLIY